MKIACVRIVPCPPTCSEGRRTERLHVVVQPFVVEADGRAQAVAVVWLGGTLTGINACPLAEILDALRRRRWLRVAIEATMLGGMDSDAVRALSSARTALRDEGGDLRVLSARPSVEREVILAGLADSLSPEHDLPEQLLSLAFPSVPPRPAVALRRSFHLA